MRKPQAFAGAAVKLRYYQEEAVAALLAFRSQHPDGNPLVALPTGAGKSLVIASFLSTVFAHFSDTRALMLTHVKTLIEQNHAALVRAWPLAPVGVYSAGLRSHDASQPITFAGIQSVYGKAALFGHIDVVFIDEAHLVSPKAKTMYFAFLAALRERNPRLMVIGLTATPYRSNTGSLIKGDGAIFTHVCYDRTQREAFLQLVEDGFLARLTTKRTDTEIDTSQVKMRGDDFNETALGKAVLADFPNVEKCVAETILEGASRTHWLVFTVNIEHATAVHKLFTAAGVHCGIYHSEQESAENTRALADFKAGKLQALVNVNCLTTGIDVPAIDLISVMRPTRSVVLWVQMLGRGLRVHKGKTDCKVLDFGHCAEVLGPINDPVIPNAKTPVKDCASCATYRRMRNADGQLTYSKCPLCSKSFAAPMVACPSCGFYNHAGCATCATCGFRFPRNRDAQATAATVPVVATAERPSYTLPVLGIEYNLHAKNGRHSLRITYTCGAYQLIDRYVCFEHDRGTYPRTLAHRFWMQHRPPDCTVAEPSAAYVLAIARQLRQPTNITVKKEGKFYNVLNQQFE